MLKRWLILRQREWAQALAARIAKIKPAALDCHASGWAEGCIPLLEFRRLEWVNVTLEFGDGLSIGNEYYYPDEPTDEQISCDCARLIKSAYAMGIGIGAV
jgi:hypothetical protein